MEKKEHPSVLLRKLSKNERKLKSLVHTSSGRSSKALRYTHSLPAKLRVRRVPPDLETGFSHDTNQETEETTLKLQMSKTPLEDKAVPLAGEDITFLNVGNEQASNRQTSAEGAEVNKSDNQTEVIPSKVILGYKTSSSATEGNEPLVDLDDKNDTREPKNKVNDSLEEMAITLKESDIVWTKMQRDDLQGISNVCFPLQNSKSPMNKQAIKCDTISRQQTTLDPVGAIMGENEIKKEMALTLAEKRKECASLDAMTLRSQEICKDTYQRLDSLEETIKDLEMAISKISCKVSTDLMVPQNFLGQLGSKDAENEKRKLETDTSRYNVSDFRDLKLDCQELRQCDANNNTPSGKPPLLPKPRFLMNSDPQVYFFLKLLFLCCTSARFFKGFSVVCPQDFICF